MRTLLSMLPTLLAAFCLLTACNDPFGEETKAKIELSIRLSSLEALDGSVKLDNGLLRVSSLMITNDSEDDGRETATAEIPSDQSFILNGIDPNLPINFSLSKGLSSRIQLTMVLPFKHYDITNINSDDGRDSVDLTAYFEEATPSLFFAGTAAFSSGTKKIIVAIDSLPQLTFMGSSDGPSGEGAFDQSIIIEERNKATVFFNANTLFSDVTQTMLASAKSQVHDGVPTIFIHRRHNRNIYDAITKKMIAPGHVLIRGY